MVRSNAGAVLLPRALGRSELHWRLRGSCDLYDDHAGTGTGRVCASQTRQLAHVSSDPLVPAPQGLKVFLKLRHGG